MLSTIEQIFLTEVRRTLTASRLARSSETELQESIEAALAREGFASVQREVELSPTDRIDFLLDSGVGLEVKMAGSLASVTRQLSRYARSPRVNVLVLVTTRSQLRAVPAELLGKPVEVIYLSPL